MLIKFLFVTVIAIGCVGCAHNEPPLAAEPKALAVNPSLSTAQQPPLMQGNSASPTPSAARSQLQSGQVAVAGTAPPPSQFNSNPYPRAPLTTAGLPASPQTNDDCLNGQDNCLDNHHPPHPHPHSEHDIEIPDEPRNHEGPRKSPTEEVAERTRTENGFDKQAFLKGLNGWVVSRNSNGVPNKIFIHRAVSSNALVDLLYNVKLESDGSWTVYDPGGSGVPSFGRRIGSIERPPLVRIIPCNCM
jgi:hypothetical protein